MKKNVVWMLVFFSTIIIIIFYIFSLKYIFQKQSGTEGFFDSLKQTINNANRSYEELKDDFNLKYSQEPEKPLTNKQLDSLKQKVLEYGQEQPTTE